MAKSILLYDQIDLGDKNESCLLRAPSLIEES